MENLTVAQNIFQETVDTLHRMVGELPVCIWTPDKARTQLTILAANGIDASHRANAVIPLDKPSVTGDVFNSHQAEVIPDIAQEPRWQYKLEPKEFGWKSALLIPIVSHGIAQGVVNIYTTSSDADLGKLRSLMELHAHQIGLTMEASHHRGILEHLLEISKKFDEITDQPFKVLKEIVKRACEVSGADCAVLYPYDPDRDEFYDHEYVAAYGLREDLKLKEKPRSPQSMTARVKRDGEIIIENIQEQDPKMFQSPLIRREGIQSFIALALGMDRVVVGFLFINFRNHHKFSDEEKDTIHLFAHQARIAIDNMRLYAQARQRAEALKQLHAVNVHLVSAGQVNYLKDTLDKIAQDARAILRADLVDIYCYDEQEDRFPLLPSQAGQRSSPPVERIYPDDVAYELIKFREPIFMRKSQESAIFMRPFSIHRPDTLVQKRFVVRENILSTAVVPLMFEDRPVGLLFANYRQEQTFPDTLRELLNVFATQVAVAIANGRLHERSYRQAEALKRLNTVAARLVKLGEDTDNISRLMTEIAEGAQEVLNADLVAIYQYNQGYDEFSPEFLTEVGERKYSVKKNRIYPDDLAYTVVKSDEALYESEAQTNPVLISSHEQHTDVPPQRFVIRENIHSMAGIPMKVGAETVGVLFVSYHEKQIFFDQQKELIGLFAAQAAIAIRNMRLLLRQKALQKFGEAITSTAKRRLTEAEVLDLIVAHVHGIMDTSNMYIALYDQASDSIRFGLAYQNGRRVDYPSRKVNPQQLGKTEVILFHEPYILQSTRADVDAWFAQHGHGQFVRGMDEASWLGVRMNIEDKVLGVIATYHSTREQVYSSEDLATLQTIANQAAISIDNARMYYNINRKLDSIVRFGENISSGKRLNQEEVLNLICQQVKEHMNAESMYIALYDDVTELVRFGRVYQNGKQVDVDKDPNFKPRQAGKGKTEEIIRTRQPIFHPTSAEAEAWYAAPGREEYTGKPLPSWLGVPVCMGEHVLGVIAVYHETEEFLYTEDNLSILQAIANRAALALDNAHRYYETEQNLHALVEFGQAITDIHIPRQELLELIRQKADQFLDADNMFIALCGREDEKDIIRFEIVYRDGLPTSRPDRLFSEGRVGEIIRTKKAIFLPTRKDIETWLEQHDDYKETEISFSWLGVPMIVGDQVLGVIGVDHPIREEWYNGENQEILRALANLAAIALENARLYEKARDDLIATEQLSMLGEASAALQHRINNTLNMIPPNLQRLMKRLPLNDPDVDESLGIIQRNMEHTTKLLQRIQSPMRQAALSNVNINSTITEIFNNRHSEWTADKTHYLIETRLETDENIPVIRLPVGQLSEVLTNLIDNAYRALDKSIREKNQAGSAKLQVTSKLESATISIRVIDNLPGGIPLSVRNKIFKKPVSSNTEDGGSGFGLWLSKLIMKRIGGDIRIEYSGLTGTRMLIEIPTQNL